MRKSTHTPDYDALRTTLTETRRAAHLSQRDLAARLRVPHSWIAKVESGERRIDLIEFAWFCRACGGDPVAVATPLLNQIAAPPNSRHAKLPKRARTGGPR